MKEYCTACHDGNVWPYCHSAQKQWVDNAMNQIKDNQAVSGAGVPLHVGRMIDGKNQFRDNLNRYRWVFVGSDGWPVEGIIGRPLKTFLRRLFLTRKMERYHKWLKRTGTRIDFSN